MPKRRKAKVNGGIDTREYLKIGEAAPQMIFAAIRARMAFLRVDKSDMYLVSSI